MEDVYLASVETDRGVKEQLRLYDTRGLQEGVELPKHYFSVADGFVLVYAVTSLEAFQRVELLKKEIDVFRDKKEVNAWRLNRLVYRCISGRKLRLQSIDFAYVKRTQRKTNVPTALGNPAKGGFLVLGKAHSHATQVMQKNVGVFSLLASSTTAKIQLAECTSQDTYD